MDKQDDLRSDYLLISRGCLEIFLGSMTKSKPDISADFLTCYFQQIYLYKVPKIVVSTIIGLGLGVPAPGCSSAESSIAGRAIHMDSESN